MFQKPIKKSSDIPKQKPVVEKPEGKAEPVPVTPIQSVQPATVVQPQTIIVKNKGINPFFPLKIVLEIGRWAIILILIAIIAIALLAVLHGLYPEKFVFMNDLTSMLNVYTEKLWASSQKG